MYIRRTYKYKKMLNAPYFLVTTFKSGSACMVVYSPPHEQTLGLDKRLRLSSPVLIEVDMKENTEEENNGNVVFKKKIHGSAGKYIGGQALLRPPAPPPLYTLASYTVHLKTT
jgi:hypothetical protein